MIRTSSPSLPREYRVALSRRVTHAEVVSANEPLPRLFQPAEPQPPAPPVSAPTEGGVNHLPPPPADTPTVVKSQIDARLAEERAAVEAVLAAVRGATADLRRQHADRLQEWQRAAVELGLAIAAKLLHERVTQDDYPVDEIVRQMAGRMVDDEVVTVRMNPTDLALLERRMDGQPLFPDRDDPALVADPTLGRAECRIEGRALVLLSDLPRQLTQIRDDLIGSLAHART
ncbi:MAG: FliH/SctL family protein [Gemmataceae bacterium]